MMGADQHQSVTPGRHRLERTEGLCHRPGEAMAAASSAHSVTGLRRYAQAAGISIMLLGCVVLTGWAFDAPALRSAIPGLKSMNPGSALAFLLAGTSVWAQSSSRQSPRLRTVALACASAVLLIGLLRLTGYVIGWDGGPDQVLFHDRLELEAVRVGQANRMAPNTAAGFTLVGLALLLLDVRPRRGIPPAQLLALAAAVIALLALIGYAYSTLSLIGVRQFIPMALNTAVAFALLSAAILCARPDRGLMAVVTSESPGGGRAVPHGSGEG